jgi:hypothetical protein
MNRIAGLGFAAAIACILLVQAPCAAQSPVQESSAYTLRVEGLTSEHRDALQAQLKGRTDLRLVFACVPAGVLVFEPAPGEPKSSTAQRAMHLLDAQQMRSKREELTEGRAAAEAACAQARNR